MLWRNAPPSSDGFIHFRHVFVVDAGDENRIHFAKNVGFFEGLQAFHLPLVEDLHPFQTAVALAAVVHPGVDFHPNFRVHHINGNGDVVNVELLDAVHIVGQHQTVGGEAELNVGGPALQPVQRCGRFFRGWPGGRQGQRCPAPSFGESCPQRP